MNENIEKFANEIDFIFQKWRGKVSRRSRNNARAILQIEIWGIIFKQFSSPAPPLLICAIWTQLILGIIPCRVKQMFPQEPEEVEQRANQQSMHWETFSTSY